MLLGAPVPQNQFLYREYLATAGRTEAAAGQLHRGLPGGPAKLCRSGGAGRAPPQEPLSRNEVSYRCKNLPAF